MIFKNNISPPYAFSELLVGVKMENRGWFIGKRLTVITP